MHLRILGPLEVAGSGGHVQLGGRRQRAVLAALVVAAGRVVTVDHLADAVWGEDAPRSAAKTIQNYVLRLRKLLGPDVIETATGGYRLSPAVGIDAQELERLAREGRAAATAGQPDDAATVLRSALTLWRGRPLDELVGWALADAEVARLEELQRGVAEDLMAAEIDAGRHALAAAELEPMVADQPLRERRWALLMLAQQRSGRQADALRTYQRARRILGEDLGIEPGRELRALEEAIARQDPGLATVRAAGPLMVPDAPRADVAPTGADAPAPGPAPYVGLVPFAADDAARFFGRAAVVDALLHSLGDVGLLALVGASGSGKSSILRAGVLPRLGTGRVLVLTPGQDPVGALAGALAGALGRPVDEVAADLRATPAALDALARELPDRTSERCPVLLVVDQMEELFSQCSDIDERRRFVALLVEAVERPDPAVRVLLGLRGDFYDRCGAHPALGRLLRSGTFLLCEMSEDERREAIEGPAASGGWMLEPGLVDVILADLGDGPGSLPLMSHALRETWERRRGRTLTVAGYRAAGGTSRAIAQTAELVYRGLDAGRRQVAQTMLLRLVEVGSGRIDTARRATRRELPPSSTAGEASVVLERLVDARLVTVDDETVELAHEAVIREWPRLRSWIDEDRSGLRVRRHLTHASTDWAERGRHPSELYRGPRLAVARAWPGQERASLSDLEVEFLEASAVAEERERVAREAADRRRRRTDRRLRVLLVATSLGLAVALLAGTVAVVQRRRAHDEAARAESAQATATIGNLVATSRVLEHDDRSVASLLAVEAYRRRDDASTRGALLESLVDEPRRVVTVPVRSSTQVWPLGGGRTAVVVGGGQASIRDLGSGRLVARIPGTSVVGAAVSPDAAAVAVADGDGTVRFVDAEGRSVGRPLATGQPTLRASMAFSPDGARLAYAPGVVGDVAPRPEMRASVYDVASGERTLGLGGSDRSVAAVAFSHDGRLVATGGNDDQVFVHDAVTGDAIGSPLPTGAPVGSVTFDPSDRRLLVGRQIDGVVVFDVATRDRVGELDGSGAHGAVSFSPSGRRFAVGGDAGVRIYDARTDAPVGDPIDPRTGEADPRMLSDTRLVVGGRSGPATVWDLTGRSVLQRDVPDAPSYVFPMHGGRLLAVPDMADSVRLVDAWTLRTVGRPLSPGPGDPAAGSQLPATFAASYHDESRIAVINRSGRMQVYAVPSGHPIGAPVELHIATVYAVFSRDMRTIVVGGRKGELLLVDLDSHHVRRLPSPTNNYVLGLSFGPNGDLVAGDLGHAVVIRHPERARPVVQVVEQAGNPLDDGVGLDLSPDGRTIAVGRAGVLHFYDERTLAETGPPVAVSGNTILWVAYGLDGRTVLVNDEAGETRLVDVASRAPVGPLFGAVGGGSVFGPDSTVIGAATPTGGALFDADPAHWEAAACHLAGRNLTAVEWARYLPGAGPRRPTCAEYP